ncbi:polysaccharide deacetylase [Marivirga lumbricoides]|uniref:Polysaccharide deacetylase n=2 Tax=Marivirga lumbricoides TaxID=1046115 RepID=A0ABQ1LZZ7_9BACT|nr:polysaccharide deacetylase [Marivirga lumbricoides]
MFDSSFYKTPTFIKYLLPQVEWKVATDKKEIYLTFDDGPIPYLTEEILVILKSYNAKATFFCVGDNVRKHPEIFEKVIADGHVIGNHTHNHLKGWRTRHNHYLENVEECAQNIEKFYAGSKRLFRPPYGQVSPSLARKISQAGYRIIMWDVLSKDYDIRLSPELIRKKTIESTGKGSIIVFHDNVKAQHNVLTVLPQYLQHFSNLGFKFLSL